METLSESSLVAAFEYFKKATLYFIPIRHTDLTRSLCILHWGISTLEQNLK